MLPCSWFGQQPAVACLAEGAFRNPKVNSLKVEGFLGSSTFSLQTKYLFKLIVNYACSP
jgi:hypothetical protein